MMLLLLVLLVLCVSAVSAQPACDPNDGSAVIPGAILPYHDFTGVCLCGAKNADYKEDGTSAQQAFTKFCNTGTTCTSSTKSCTCTPSKDHFCFDNKGPG